MKKFSEYRKIIRNKLPTWKKHMIGNGNGNGLLFKIAIYFLSITFAFVFIYPLFYMFMISLMSNTDLVDSTILWIPSGIYYKNYIFAVNGLRLDELYFRTMIDVIANKEVFTDDTLQTRYTDEFILAYVDTESGNRIRLPNGERTTEMQFAAKNRILGTPTFIYFSSDQKPIFKRAGFQTIEKMNKYSDFVTQQHFKSKSLKEFLVQK